MDHENTSVREVAIFPNDVTIRDGLQGSPHKMTVDQRISFASQLTRNGYWGIEAGNPMSNGNDIEAVMGIAQEVGPMELPTSSPESNHPRISALARLYPDDIQKAYYAVQKAPNPGVHLYISTSERQFRQKFAGEHMRKRGFPADDYDAFIEQWVIPDIDEHLGVLQKEHPECHIRFSPEDATRTDPRIVERVMIAAAKYSNVLNYPDTVGVMKPVVVLNRIWQLRHALDEAGFRDVLIAWHGHNDTGSAVPNAEMAIYGGAREVDTTIGGIGERAGMPGEGLWAALDVDNQPELVESFRRLIHDEQLLEAFNIRPTHPLVRKQIPVTHRLFEEYTGIRSGMFIPLMGQNIPRQRAGVHQAAMVKGMEVGDGTTYQAVDLEQYGIQPEIVISPDSGWGGLEYAFKINELPYRCGDRKVFSANLKRTGELLNRDLEPEEILEYVYYPSLIELTGGTQVNEIEPAINAVSGPCAVNIWLQKKGKWRSTPRSGIYAEAEREQGYLRAGVRGLQRLIKTVEIDGFGEESVGGHASQSYARAWVALRNDGLIVCMHGEAKDAGATAQLAALTNAFNALLARLAYERMMKEGNPE